MKFVKFFLSHLSKTTKPEQEQEHPETEKRDFVDLWSDLSEKGQEDLKKEMNQISRVRTLNDNPKEN